MPLAGACSFLLAARVGRTLVYVGRVEWGVSRRLATELRERCTILSTPVCEGAERARCVVWLEPSVRVEVQFNELMQGRLRDALLRSSNESEPSHFSTANERRNGSTVAATTANEIEEL
jgi:ATP-dependent DNA ligase